MKSTKEQREEAMKTLELPPYKIGSTFMGMTIEEFDKEDLIRILSWQNDKLLVSMGYKA